MYQFIIHYQTDGGERDGGGRFYSDCFNSWDEVRDGLIQFDYSIVGTEENVNFQNIFGNYSTR